MHHRAIATLSLCILAAAHTGCMTAVAAFQPENIGGETIVITTTDADGESHERVLSPIDDDGRLFVAANHWPRASAFAEANRERNRTAQGQQRKTRAAATSRPGTRSLRFGYTRARRPKPRGIAGISRAIAGCGREVSATAD